MAYNFLYKKVVIAEESLWSNFLPRLLRISRARNKMYYKFLLFHLLSFVTHLCVASDYSLIIVCAKLKYEIFALPLNTAIHARAYDFQDMSQFYFPLFIVLIRVGELQVYEYIHLSHVFEVYVSGLETSHNFGAKLRR